MRFETKIAVIVRDDLPVWQKLNMVAFLASGIAGSEAETMGEPYRDADGSFYRPMFRQPVLVFQADAAGLRSAFERARERGARLSVFADPLFSTGHDAANRAAVAAYAVADLPLAGFALHEDRRLVDKVVKGLALHP